MKPILVIGMPRISMTYPQLRRREIVVNGVLYQLTERQHRLVEVLLLRRGEVLPKRELAELYWPNPDDEPEGDVRNYLATIRVLIHAQVGRIIYSYGMRSYASRNGQQGKHHTFGWVIPLPDGSIK